jgi:hypothetical protein
MKVKELKELLEGYSDDMEVHFSYNYGDHWHTQVAPKVREVDELEVTYSGYHEMDKLADEPDNDDDEDERKELDKDRRMVVVLS